MTRHGTQPKTKEARVCGSQNGACYGNNTGCRELMGEFTLFIPRAERTSELKIGSSGCSAATLIAADAGPIIALGCSVSPRLKIGRRLIEAEL